MRIARVEVIGFGCLNRHEFRFDAERAFVLLAPNEAGKSTLLLAIETALYGLPPRMRAEGRELRQRIRPWSGGPSRVVLELRGQDHGYRVDYEILDPAGEAVERSTVMRDQRDVTDEMLRHAAAPGDWLLGIGRDDFRRSVLVRQGDLEAVADDTDQLVHHLEQIATSTEAGGASAADAGQRLRESLTDYRGLAGLEHWSKSHLEGAKKWSGVQRRLEQVIADHEAERSALLERREALAHQIQSFETQDETLAELREALARLRVLEMTIRLREARSRLARDDETGHRLTTLDREIQSLDDVARFPQQRAGEFEALMEREAQLRRRLAELADHARRDRQALEAIEQEMERLPGVAGLLDRGGQLEERLTLYRRSVEMASAADRDRSAAVGQLQEEGVPLDRLREARKCYLSLTAEEREWVRDLDRRLLDYRRRRGEAEDTIRTAREELRTIRCERSRRGRRALWIMTGSVVAGAAGGLLAWAAGVSPAAAAGVGLLVAVAGCVPGVWLQISAGHVRSYRFDELNARTEEAERAISAVDQGETGDLQRVDSIAASRGMSREDLIEAVRFYLGSHDKLDTCERLDSRAAECREEVSAHQRAWAEWLKEAGTQVAPERVSVESAAALLDQVRRLTERRREAAALRKSCEDIARAEEQRREDAVKVQREIITLLQAAGVEVVLHAGPGELAAESELEQARAEFSEKVTRFQKRSRLMTECDAVSGNRLEAEDRSRLEQQVAELATEVDDEDMAQSALAWLASCRLEELRRLAPAERPSELEEEHIRKARIRIESEVERRRAAAEGMWLEARSFLQDYAARMAGLEDELRRLWAELRRGTRFARAITTAAEVLQHVQANSYERWSQMLAERLRPLLADWLPDYEFREVTAGLAPVLAHRPTGQQLDLDGIRLHLSRGARDRLFLAVRLALAQVLGGERGTRLPLLLDDPLANWDDGALLEGLRVLNEAAGPADSLIVFTCQQSRVEWALRRPELLDCGITVHRFDPAGREC